MTILAVLKQTQSQTVVCFPQGKDVALSQHIKIEEKRHIPEDLGVSKTYPVCSIRIGRLKDHISQKV